MKNTTVFTILLSTAAHCMSMDPTGYAARRMSQEMKPSIQKTYITDDMVQTMCTQIHQKVQNSGFAPELLIGIARGGLVPLGLLAGEKMFDNRNTRTINIESYEGQTRKTLKLKYPIHTEDFENSKNILIVDDLVDTGETMKFLIEALKDSLPKTTIKIATLYYKPTSCIKPDYYIEETTNWIVFPWEK